MINVIKYPDRTNWQEIIKRPVLETVSLEKAVKKILEKVKEKGDKAVKKYTNEFDGVKLKKLLVSEKEIEEAEKLFRQVLSLDGNHQGAIIHKGMMQYMTLTESTLNIK